MKLSLPFFGLIFLTGSACEDVSQKPLHSVTTDLLVVESNITSENIRQLVRLSFPYETQNGTGAAVTGATVTLSWGDSSRSLAEDPAGSGFYYTPVMRAITGITYRLEIAYKAKSYFAEDTAVPVEAMSPLQYQRSGDKYVLTLNPSGAQPNFIEHSIDWKNTSACSTGVGCDGEIYFYDLKTTDVNDIFKPGKVEFDFPVDATVIRRKYSVSAAYRAFLRSMLSETEWHGGVFDVQAAPVTTNLSDGAIGFFAVSAVVSDTTIVVEKP